jgi:hypothetical protein
MLITKPPGWQKESQYDNKSPEDGSRANSRNVVYLKSVVESHKLIFSLLPGFEYGLK